MLGVITPSQRPLWAVTENTSGEPNSVFALTRATTAPPGAARSTTARATGRATRAAFAEAALARSEAANAATKATRPKRAPEYPDS
jgi:hypothetical protein